MTCPAGKVALRARLLFCGHGQCTARGSGPGAGRHSPQPPNSILSCAPKTSGAGGATQQPPGGKARSSHVLLRDQPRFCLFKFVFPQPDGLCASRVLLLKGTGSRLSARTPRSRAGTLRLRRPRLIWGRVPEGAGAPTPAWGPCLRHAPGWECPEGRSLRQGFLPAPTGAGRQTRGHGPGHPATRPPGPRLQAPARRGRGLGVHL